MHIIYNVYLFLQIVWLFVQFKKKLLYLYLLYLCINPNLITKCERTIFKIIFRIVKKINEIGFEIIWYWSYCWTFVIWTKHAVVPLPDTNYSTFLQVVDPFIPVTPRSISHDHGQVRFNAGSKHWFPAADSTSCNSVRIFHVRGTI